MSPYQELREHQGPSQAEGEWQCSTKAVRIAVTLTIVRRRKCAVDRKLSKEYSGKCALQAGAHRASKVWTKH